MHFIVAGPQILSAALAVVAGFVDPVARQHALNRILAQLPFMRSAQAKTTENPD